MVPKFKRDKKNCQQKSKCWSPKHNGFLPFFIFIKIPSDFG